MPERTADFEDKKRENTRSLYVYALLILVSVICGVTLSRMKVDDKVITGICAAIIYIPMELYKFYRENRKDEAIRVQEWKLKGEFPDSPWLVSLQFIIAYESLTRIFIGTLSVFIASNLKDDTALRYGALKLITESVASSIAVVLFPPLLIFLARNAAYKIRKHKGRWIGGAVFLSTLAATPINYFESRQAASLPITYTVLAAIVAATALALVAQVGVIWSSYTYDGHLLKRLFHRLSREQQQTCIARVKLDLGLSRRHK